MILQISITSNKFHTKQDRKFLWIVYPDRLVTE